MAGNWLRHLATRQISPSAYVSLARLIGLFAPLIAYLVAHDSGDLTLLLAEIEAIIDCPLPNSAYVTSGYWIDKDAPLVRWMSAHG